MAGTILHSRTHVPLAFTCAVGAALLLAGCSGGVLDARGPIAAADSRIMLNALGIMLFVVVPTIAVALGFAWWFRASNKRARYLPHWAYSGELELIVWAIPVLVIMFLGGVIWIGSHELDPYQPIASKAKPLEVQVVSLDWKWLFIYPDQGVASVNQLVVPVGVPLHFSLTSASVMNSFFVPQLGSMIATMNGMVTQLYLQADTAGDYHGLSTQFSGDGFADMEFTVHAVPLAEFDRWIGTTRQSGPVLDRAAYGDLTQESSNVKPFTYRSVAPDLFHAVATDELPPGPGPATNRGGAAGESKGKEGAAASPPKGAG